MISSFDGFCAPKQNHGKWVQNWKDSEQHACSWAKDGNERQIQAYRPSQGPAVSKEQQRHQDSWRSQVPVGTTRGDAGLGSRGNSPPAEEQEIKAKQNCRLTAVFREISAQDRKPQKSRLSAP